MSESVLHRLERGDVLVMDGGTGSELHRRGCDLLRKRAAGDTRTWFNEAWSASVNVDAPEIPGQVHADYLRVGADILLTNTFYTGPTRLSVIGAEKDWERLQDTAIEQALTVRDRDRPDAYVFGAWAPPWMHHTGPDRPADRSSAVYSMSNTEFLGKDAFVNETRAVGERMAKSGVDALLLECMLHADDVASFVEALGHLDLPLFIGIEAAQPDGRLLWHGSTGHSIAQFEDVFAGGQVAGVMLMCTELENCTPALGHLRDIYGGYTGAYPNNGYASATKAGKDALDLFPNPDLPSDFARATVEWIDLGAQIVGGCCGTGPEHTRAQRHTVDTHAATQGATAS